MSSNKERVSVKNNDNGCLSFKNILMFKIRGHKHLFVWNCKEAQCNSKHLPCVWIALHKDMNIYCFLIKNYLKNLVGLILEVPGNQDKMTHSMRSQVSSFCFQNNYFRRRETLIGLQSTQTAHFGKQPSPLWDCICKNRTWQYSQNIHWAKR